MRSNHRSEKQREAKRDRDMSRCDFSSVSCQSATADNLCLREFGLIGNKGLAYLKRCPRGRRGVHVASSLLRTFTLTSTLISLLKPTVSSSRSYTVYRFLSSLTPRLDVIENHHNSKEDFSVFSVRNNCKNCETLVVIQ
jgi:hypothetical protein